MAVDTVPLAAQRLAVEGVVEDGAAGDGGGEGVSACQGDWGGGVVIWNSSIVGDGGG